MINRYDWSAFVLLAHVESWSTNETLGFTVVVAVVASKRRELASGAFSIDKLVIVSAIGASGSVKQLEVVAIWINVLNSNTAGSFYGQHVWAKALATSG